MFASRKLKEKTVPRIPLPTPETMTPEQRKVYDMIVTGPRGTLVGPLRAALHRPELAEKWQQLGELLRFRTSLAPQLSELAILVTARRWSCQVEWYMHARAAAACGLDPAIVEAIRNGQEPTFTDTHARLVYDYSVELSARGKVSETAYQATLAAIGDVGLVELTALIGYYSMVAMTLNAHEIPLPDGAEPPLPDIVN
ncbi:MAG: carboxymuconolactone decarboxylase family protein [Rhizobiales bacterium]|nr:carboxymuconolactone decarboxylase family protein [Hyphomicrobiales bacterium]